ncbi:MAG: hypothetical protein HY364_04320 [Candidatus Aenigmarchaeota archaeon]|nr:hypothetical protein [Candidatus Aenigmarchaeota archaeon]
MATIITENIGNIKIQYGEADQAIIDVFVDGNNFKDLSKLFSESNYNAVNMLYIAPEFETICHKLFDTIKVIIDRKDFILGKNLSDYVFGQTLFLWEYYLIHRRHMLGTELLQHICRIVFSWEEKNRAQIHKGTPYFFLGLTQLMQGNVDAGFLMVYNAIEEDKRYCRQIGQINLYKGMPAYSFCTVNIKQTKNAAYDYVIEANKELQKFIDNFNSSGFKYKTSLNEFQTKFLENTDIENEKFFFVYNLFTVVYQNVLKRKELENNIFSKLRNVDMIFNFCLIIDKILNHKTGKQYISDSIIKIARNNFSINNAQNIYKSLDFENNVESAINNCLSPSYTHNSITVPKELLSLILIWGLRNHGGHTVETLDIFVEKYEEIKQAIMNSYFIVLKELY